MEDSEWSKKLVLELLILRRFNVVAIQPDLVTWSVALALDSLIVGSLL